jgi:hypothetical protein
MSRTRTFSAVQIPDSLLPACDDATDTIVSSKARAAAATPANSKIAAVPLNRCARLRKSSNIGAGHSGVHVRAALRAANWIPSLCSRTQKAWRISSKLSLGADIAAGLGDRNLVVLIFHSLARVGQQRLRASHTRFRDPVPTQTLACIHAPVRRPQQVFNF